MDIIRLCQNAAVGQSARLEKLLTQLGNQILLSSEKLPRKKLLDIFQCSTDRVEIQCKYTDDGFLEFYLDEVSDYRIFLDDSIIGRVRADDLPLTEISSILREKASKSTEIVMGNIFLIYPDAMSIKFLFHNPEVPAYEIHSYKNTEICQKFSADCTGGMNIIKLYQKYILSNITYLKGLLQELGNQILAFSNNLPSQKVIDSCNVFDGRIEIKCTYAKSGRFTFYAGNDKSYFDHKFIGRVEGKKGLTKEINAFLKKRYPGVKISNECIIYPDTGTIKFYFKFKTSLTERDLVHPFPSIVKYANECTSKRKLLQDEFVWIFSADLIKMQNPNVGIYESLIGENETMFNITNITAFDMETMLFQTAEFQVEISFETPLKV